MPNKGARERIGRRPRTDWARGREPSGGEVVRFPYEAMIQGAPRGRPGECNGYAAMTRSLQSTTRPRSIAMIAALVAGVAVTALEGVGCTAPVNALEDGASPMTSSPATEPTVGTDTNVGDSAPGDSHYTKDAGSDASTTSTDSGQSKSTDAFAGAPGFLPQPGMSARQAGHSFNSNTPKTNPAGKACLNCHGGGSAPAFAAAGTVYDGTAPAASVEVRAYGADGKAYSAYTDADGNFFIRATTQLTLPAFVGARNAASTRVMGSAANKGNCNECHSTAGGAGRISVGP